VKRETQHESAESLSEALYRLGLAAVQAGDIRLGLVRLQDAIEADPGNAAYHLSQAEILRRLGELDDAEAAYHRALVLQPEQARIHRDLAVLLHERGRLDEAETHYRAALQLVPNALDNLNNLGNLLKDRGQLKEAEMQYRAALAIRPDFAEGQCNLGNLLADIGRRDEAEVCFRTAIRLRPDLPEAHNNLGNLLRDLGRPTEAAATCQEAIRLRPLYASAYSNLANAFRDLDRPADAEVAYRAALRIAPDFATARSNLATVLLEVGQLDRAIAEYRTAIELDPDYADAHNNLGIALLLDGEFAEGWQRTEWRWRTKKNADLSQRFTQPLWGGDATGDRVLLLYAEQGFGDTLQFCRYVALVAAQHRVVLEVQRPLVPLLAGLPGIEQIVAQGDPLPDFDLRCPLLSLPRLCGTTLHTIPTQIPYVAVDPVRAEHWRARTADLVGLKVGLVWAGNPGMAANRRRSIDLAQLAPFAKVPGVSFVSLQKGSPAAQARTPGAGMVIYDWTEELNDFADTAALIDTLDLVIGVDTAVIHLTGALGKPVWLLNRFDCCWRWLRARDDSPWYPTLRQFRQPNPGEWKEAIAAAAAALAERAASRDPQRMSDTVSFDRALRFHRSGRWPEAEQTYREILRIDPEHSDSQHLLGVIALQRGKPVEALEFIGKALRQRPLEGSYHGNLALVFKALGRRGEAEAALRRALALKPDQADAWNNLANLLNDGGQITEAEACYREALHRRPDFAVSRSSFGALLLRSGRREEAVEQYRALVVLRPEDAALRRQLAGLLQALGRFDEAMDQYLNALRIGPDDPALRIDLGNLLKERGKSAEAESQYRCALALRPNFLAGLINLSSLVNEAGRTEEAEMLCREALRIMPNSAEAYNNLGLILKETGRPEDAELCYRNAIRLKPIFPEPLNNLGDLLREQERIEEAELCCNEAIRLRPNYASAYNNLGNVLWMSGRLDAAELRYRDALRLKPEFTSALSNLGTVLIELDRHAEAETVLRQALQINPNFADAHSNLGVALVELGQPEQAVRHYREALRIKPDYAEAHSNLGSVFQNGGDVDNAITQFRQAIRSKPNYPDGHNNLAIALLLAGQLTEGWAEYEWRWRLKKQLKHVRPFKQPLWAGEETGDRVLLLHAEQGFGDTLQFCRYAPLVAVGRRVVLEVQRALVPLLTGMPGVEQVVSYGDPLPEFDLHCPLLSLPGVLRTTVESIPNTAPYLAANAMAAEAWRERLAVLPGKKVGVVWGGNPAMSADRRRTIELTQLASLASVSGVSFVSLQKGAPAAQAASPPPDFILHDWTAELNDFAATAALVEALDLVIGVDTSVIHLAGALGKPVWLLNRFDCCWRWLRECDNSAWYPSLRQFRQTTPGGWSDPIARLQRALKNWAMNGRASPDDTGFQDA
jgi:tetratricopeptide (TPR) repeat protein